MDRFIIQGGNKLKGEVEISGAKNAVLPIMASTIISPGKYQLNNVPNLRDTLTMKKLLEIIGAKVHFKENIMNIDTTYCNSPKAPYDLVKTMLRAHKTVLRAGIIRAPLLYSTPECKKTSTSHQI